MANDFVALSDTDASEIPKWPQSVTLAAGQTRASIALFALPGAIGETDPQAWYGFEGRGQFFDVQEDQYITIGSA